MTRLSPKAGLQLTLVNASLLALLVGYSRNTLEQHPQLVLAKQLYTYPPVGTFECLSSRQLLASDRLNFSAWHGFQQVHFGPLEGGLGLELQFRLQPQAYLLLTTTHTPRLQQGLRLSLHSGLPLRAGVARNHDILNRLSRRHRLPLLNLDQALRERLNQGFLWVDRVHLTSYGQQCAAELLARELLSAECSPPPP